MSYLRALKLVRLMFGPFKGFQRFAFSKFEKSTENRYLLPFSINYDRILLLGAVFMANALLDFCHAKDVLQGCFIEAGRAYKVDPVLLYSIARIESNFNAKATNTNRNGTRDVGIMQINSSWLSTLQKNGINEKSLFEPCLNVRVGAWILAQAIKDNGNNWRAVGAYNAGGATGEKHEKNRILYAQKIYRYYSTLKLRSLAKQRPHKGAPNNHG